MSDLESRRKERQIEADLARLRSSPAPPVDVRSRVLARVAGLRPVRPRQVPWLALAASVALAACLGLANASTLPVLPNALRELASVSRGPRSALEGLAVSSLSSTLASLSEAISRLVGFAVALLDLLERYAWAWKPGLAAAFALAVLAACLFLVREFRRAPRTPSLEETRHDS